MKRKKSSEKNMTLSGHLRELRRRVIICVICLVVSFFIGLNFAPELVAILTGIGEQYGYTYIFIAPQELLMQYFSVAMLASVCITLPILVYQIWAFVRPGLRRNENILLIAALIFGLICFVLGVLFAYKIMMPFMLYFLMDLSAGSEIAASISVQSYMSFVLSTFMIFGIIFELPVMSVLLTQLGFLKVLKGSGMKEDADGYEIRYHEHAPYEVLTTRWLNYGEVLTLKGVEEMVEVYYNSRQYNRRIPPV